MQHNSPQRNRPNRQKLPDVTVLKQMLDDGLTVPEMMDACEAITGERATEAALRQKLHRSGLSINPARPNHRHLFGAKQVPSRLQNDELLKWLKLDNKMRHPAKEQLRPSDRDLCRLEKWRNWMDGDNKLGVPIVVQFEDDRFTVRPRRPGDGLYDGR